jgi:hypothetical protein
MAVGPVCLEEFYACGKDSPVCSKIDAFKLPSDI